MAQKIALIVNNDGDLDVELHPSREEAESALVGYMEDIFGTIYDYVPSHYEPEHIQEWLTLNKEKLAWSFKEMEV